MSHAISYAHVLVYGYIERGIAAAIYHGFESLPHMRKVMTVYREKLLVRPSVMLSVTDCSCQIVVGLLG